MKSLDIFTRAYLECMLWSTSDESDPETGGEPLDVHYTIDNIAPEALKAAIRECRAFQVETLDYLMPAYESDMPYGPDQAGHDFWLTRNGHGAGFWDRNLGATGERLTKSAHTFGELSPYVGDDGLIYGLGE